MKQSMNNRVGFVVKRKKITAYNALIGLYISMPIIDSISGAYHDVYPVGQIYRLVVMAYMIILLGKNSDKEFVKVMIPFAIFVLVQILISDAYLVKSIQSTLKLFTPIITIELFRVLIRKQKIHNEDVLLILDIWSVLYPLMILVPGAFGIGINAYDGSIGWEGFFYATNEISFILSSLVMYLFWKFENVGNIKSIVTLAANCLCVVLMGTKTGYLTIILFSIIFVFELFKDGKQNKIIRVSILLLLLLGMIILNFSKIMNMASAIYERWLFQRSISYSVTDFLFSMRLRRLEDAFNIYMDGNYLMFGWGLGGELAGFPNMEMDFLDILFRMGIIGFLYVILFYGKEVIKVARKNMWGLLIVCWSLALSFGAGHVLFYGQSGMMLAINFIFTLYILKTKNNEKLPITREEADE